MPEAVFREKNPVFVESGRRAARKRWGPQRVVRIDELNPSVAAAVRALLVANEAARSKPDPDLPEAA